MPDPIQIVKAMGAAAVASAVLALAVGWIRRPAGTGRINRACVLAIGLGLIAGYWVLELLPSGSPQNVRDRFLAIVLPAALGIELIAGFHRVPAIAAWGLRVVLACATPRILLHGSTYLVDPAAESSVGKSLEYMALGGGLLIMGWGLLASLSQRSPGVWLPLVLSETSLCAGVTVMLSAFPSGGESGLPLAASLAALAGVLWLVSKPEASQGALGVGVVGLFGVLFLGRFFGELSTGRALAVFLAPVSCWLTELPWLRTLKPWKIGAIRIALVAIPLLMVVALAKRDFDRNMEANSGYASASFGSKY